jgi:hypothetical protein
LFSAARLCDKQRSDMRDKKDNATFDLPGFGPAAPLAPLSTDARRASAPRPRKAAIRQEQLELLDETDATGLPVWRRDENTDLTGLPIWAAA